MQKYVNFGGPDIQTPTRIFSLNSLNKCHNTRRRCFVLYRCVATRLDHHYYNSMSDKGPIYVVIWLALLWFLSWPIAFACVWFWIILQVRKDCRRVEHDDATNANALHSPPVHVEIRSTSSNTLLLTTTCQSSTTYFSFSFH